VKIEVKGRERCEAMKEVQIDGYVSYGENGFWLGAVVQSNFIPLGRSPLPFLICEELLNSCFQRRQEIPQDLLKLMIVL
jgi:hypothetical protein